MLRRTTLAAAAIILASPAIADETCLTDTRGAQCDVPLEEYRTNEVPIGTTDVQASDDFLIERPQDLRPEPGIEFPTGRDVLFWDGDSGMIVPEETGPRLEVADW